SGSSRNATSTWNEPEAIQFHTTSVTCRCSTGSADSAKKSLSATRNAAPTTAHATAPTTRLGRRGTKTRLNRNPASGSSGMSQSESSMDLRGRGAGPSALEAVHFVHVHGLSRAEHVDDDGQAHGDLGRGHDHDEEHEHLAVEVVQALRERDQRHVGG